MKDYPLRDHAELLDKLHDVCSCGHGKYQHEVHIEDFKQCCKICVCPNFEFEQQLTLKEVFKLHKKIEEQKRRLGYTT